MNGDIIQETKRPYVYFYCIWSLVLLYDVAVLSVCMQMGVPFILFSPSRWESYDLLIVQLALVFMSEDQSIFHSLDPKIPAFLCWECPR